MKRTLKPFLMTALVCVLTMFIVNKVSFLKNFIMGA